MKPPYEELEAKLSNYQTILGRVRDNLKEIILCFDNRLVPNEQVNSMVLMAQQALQSLSEIMEKP